MHFTGTYYIAWIKLAVGKQPRTHEFDFHLSCELTSVNLGNLQLSASHRGII